MIIDTMVFAYDLLNVEPFCEEAHRVLSTVSLIIVPDSWRAEMANVTWQWAKERQMSAAIATEVLQNADELVDHVISSQNLWKRALKMALDTNHPVYDTLFLAAAERFALKVITYDRPMLRKFPTLTLHPKDFLIQANF